MIAVDVAAQDGLRLTVRARIAVRWSHSTGPEIGEVEHFSSRVELYDLIALVDFEALDASIVQSMVPIAAA